MGRVAQHAVFIVVVASVVAATHFYLWVRLVRDTGLPAPWRHVALYGLVALAASLPLAFVFSHILPPGRARTLSTLPYVWMGAMIFLVSLSLSADAIRLFVRFADRSFLDGRILGAAGRGLSLARGLAIAVIAISMILSAVAVRGGLAEPVVKRVTVRLARLPDALSGTTIAQITDLHIGAPLGREWLERVVKRVDSLGPDIVVLTGDIADGDVETMDREIAPLGGLRAPLGVFAVTGNHEHYGDAGAWTARFADLGMKVLVNERATVERGGAALDIAGVPDRAAERLGPVRPDLASALAGRDPSREVVLIAHDPRVVEEASRHDVGLVIAGHTHGGQIWPFSALVGLTQPFLSGLHRVSNTQIYVSEGTGLWGPPMRLGTTSEIALITLIGR